MSGKLLVDGCNQFARYPAVLRPFAASGSRAMSVVPLTPEVQLVQVQADLATLQYVLAHLIVRLPPNDQEVVVGMVEAAARSLDDLDRHLPPGPGTAEEMSHQTNLSARKFLTLVANCRSNLPKAAR